MDSSNSLVLNFAFPCGLRGFHVYKELSNPKLNEKLETIHEENNPHDRYAVAAIRKTVSRLRPVVVGHLPREISRFTRFIILHGATVKVKVSDTKYRRSPLIQGGLEIPVEVEVQMENSSENQQALSKYQTLVAENYHEPVNGKYVDATPDILKALDCEDELTDFEDEGDEEVDTNTADLDMLFWRLAAEVFLGISWRHYNRLALFWQLKRGACPPDIIFLYIIFLSTSENVLIPVWFFNFIDSTADTTCAREYSVSCIAFAW